MEVAILSKQEAINADKCLSPDNNVYFISIVDTKNENPKFQSAVQQLNLKFNDLNNDSLTAPNWDDAIRITEFVSEIPKGFNLLVVHCEQGISRSACVGLFAYAFHYGIPATREKFKHYFSRIQPNERLARLLEGYCCYHDNVAGFYDFIKEINTMDVLGLKKWS